MGAAGNRWRGGEQVIAGVIRDESERGGQQAGGDIVAHQPVGADGDAKARHGGLQAEVEVFEGLGRRLIACTLSGLFLPALPGGGTGLGVQAGGRGAQSRQLSSLLEKLRHLARLADGPCLLLNSSWL